jgi:hypothetical protein
MVNNEQGILHACMAATGLPPCVRRFRFIILKATSRMLAKLMLPPHLVSKVICSALCRVINIHLRARMQRMVYLRSPSCIDTDARPDPELKVNSR